MKVPARNQQKYALSCCRRRWLDAFSEYDILSSSEIAAVVRYKKGTDYISREAVNCTKGPFRRAV